MASPDVRPKFCLVLVPDMKRVDMVAAACGDNIFQGLSFAQAWLFDEDLASPDLSVHAERWHEALVSLRKDAEEVTPAKAEPTPARVPWWKRMIGWPLSIFGMKEVK